MAGCASRTDFLADSETGRSNTVYVSAHRMQRDERLQAPRSLTFTRTKNENRWTVEYWLACKLRSTACRVDDRISLKVAPTHDGGF
jgi:hypothetical protein